MDILEILMFFIGGLSMSLLFWGYICQEIEKELGKGFVNKVLSGFLVVFSLLPLIFVFWTAIKFLCIVFF